MITEHGPLCVWFLLHYRKLQCVPLFNTMQNVGMKPSRFTNRQYKQD